MHPSSAWLGSARIQLELEVFQLGSAREIFEPARLSKIGHIWAKIGSVLATKRNRLGQKIIVTLNSNSDLI